MKNLLAAMLVLIFVVACQNKAKEKAALLPGELGGDLVVFHAGSLSTPLKQVFFEFTKLHPKVNILAEAAGSRDCAKKISDLKRPCDVFFSADYHVIQQLIEQNHASWYLNFASNEMVIAYNKKSKLADKINATNWFSILENEDIKFARSNPDSDPCGYRSVFVIKLAQQFYNLSDFTDKMLFKDNQYIRPKEMDLLALLETNTVDYIFMYKSVAIQHKLKYIELPDEINLRNPAFAANYQQVEVKVSGKYPGEFQTLKAEPILYGLCIPTSSENPKLAQAFVQFFLEKQNGQRIFEANQQKFIIPAYTKTYNVMPAEFRIYASPDTLK